jgi:4-hydroxy-tetrahydrodipicolinate reductase
VSPVRIALVGMGKMGHALDQLAPERGCEVVARLDHGDAISGDALRGAEVAIEFTTPESAVPNVMALVDAGCPVVVGTTGWYAALPAVSQRVTERDGALLWASNFSVGVNLLLEIAARTGELMRGAQGFDAHIVETHHAAKKDAPSGTAGSLERAIAATLGRDVPITSVRTGSVPGTHELIFDAPFETIRLEHEARDRRVFAEGALAAARWLVGRRGVFTMRDVLAAPAAERGAPPT